MAKVDILRKKYSKFIYESYSWKVAGKDLKLSFDFKIASQFIGSVSIPPDIKFKLHLIIKNVSKKRLETIGDSVLSNLIFNLGLIEILSYWKATCSPEIIIKTGFLNKEQINWWKDLINRGMGQFFYENSINFTRPHFFEISVRQGKFNVNRYEKKLKNRVMVPIGGGKDSIVTLELLKKTKKDLICFPSKTAQNIIKISDCKKSILVDRRIDKRLLELNRKGFLNGHTPFSAYLAFLSSLLAVICDSKYVAFSNERSSNEGNLNYLGKTINHQYSKSFDFEQKFRKYSKKYLAKDLEYFSFLRPLYEIQIAKLFSKHPKYFDAFLSCNEAFKTYSGTKKPSGKWCGRCPKCLFVFSVLYPFVKKEKIIKIFGRNLFDKKELLPLMLELIGERKFKPFECVGTKKESLIAFYLSWEKEKEQNENLPFLLKYFEKKILFKYSKTYFKKESQKVLKSWNKQNNLENGFEKTLKNSF